MGGRQTEVHLAGMRLDYSSKFFVCALPGQRWEALFESHINGFTYLEGILSFVNLGKYSKELVQTNT